MSRENPLWGAPRIHGELLMLGFEVAQSTVSKYMMRGQRPPSQSWKTFLQNHAEAIAAIDMCVILGHCRRQLLWFEVTRHPTAEFNLASYDDVKPHAAAIFDRIRGIGGAVMPSRRREAKVPGLNPASISSPNGWQMVISVRWPADANKEVIEPFTP
jgi:hypothetical protein